MHTPVPVGARLPRRGGVLSQWLGAAALRLLGWRIEGELPSEPKLVVAVAPHTSNWDFVIGIATVFRLRLDAAFLGKHSLFRWPFGYLFRYLGGVPVNRGSSHGVVAQTLDAFESRSQLFLGIAPQGTRRRGAPWKRGFYHIAVGAKVPVLPVAFDYAARVVRIGRPHWPTGAEEEDISRLQAFFEGVRGRHGSGPTGD